MLHVTTTFVASPLCVGIAAAAERDDGVGGYSRVGLNVFVPFRFLSCIPTPPPPNPCTQDFPRALRIEHKVPSVCVHDVKSAFTPPPPPHKYFVTEHLPVPLTLPCPAFPPPSSTVTTIIIIENQHRRRHPRPLCIPPPLFSFSCASQQFVLCDPNGSSRCPSSRLPFLIYNVFLDNGWNDHTYWPCLSEYVHMHGRGKTYFISTPPPFPTLTVLPHGKKGTPQALPEYSDSTQLPSTPFPTLPSSFTQTSLSRVCCTT